MGWEDLLGQAINVGAQIYTGQVQKQIARQQARAAAPMARDFSQLGMGLASTGPARGPVGMPQRPLGPGGFVPTGAMSFNAPVEQAGYLRLGPGGLEIGDNGGAMAGDMIPRGPQYAIVATPSGRQKLVAIRSIGTPLLWSGDLAAVRRVARVARKLGRFIHHRPR